MLSNMKKTHKTAIIIMGVVAIWVLSSVIIPPNTGRENGEDASASTLDLASILQIEERSSQPHSRVIRIYGQTEPLRSVELKAETQGAIVDIPAVEGQPIKAGDIIVKIDERDRRARLAQAKALVNQREIEYKAAQKLKNKGFQSEVRFAETQASLASAKAELSAIELDLAYTQLKAPFDGVLDRVNVEVGDFVGVGVFGVEGALATLVDQDPLIVTGQVAEKDHAGLEVGAKANVRLNTGETVDGLVTYLSTVADAESRTFRIEVKVPNPELSLPSGVSAELQIPSSEQAAYLISPSMLALDDSGEVGVHHLNAENVVQFTPIQILDDTQEGMWVSGLPPTVRLITAAQTYVSPGQTLSDETVGKASAKEEGDAQSD